MSIDSTPPSTASPAQKSTHTKPVTGLILLGITLLTIIREWLPQWQFTTFVSLLVIIVTGMFALRVRGTQLWFTVLAVALTLATVYSSAVYLPQIQQALGTAAFIAAFFCALNSLRNAAATSPAIKRCGLFLAQQPPGRRYAALTTGTQGFALLLNYGAIALLGPLAMASAQQEPNEEIREHRKRRMLLAIQRGFIASLPWSPLSFAVVITTTVIPGASWSDAFWPCLITGVLLSGIGWSMDTLFKPRLSRSSSASQTAPVEGNWSTLLPLLFLLTLLAVVVEGLYLVSDARIAGIVITVVPFIALGWVAWQSRADNPLHTMVHRAKRYVLDDLPNFQNELSLLMMAGYIGTLGGLLLAPTLGVTGVDLSSLPPWVILVSLVWLIPIVGQIGMNPILAVSLFSPLLPEATAMGVEPVAIMVAITAGWALSGACSPFTATTLLVGSFANISAQRVSWQWNGAYSLVCAVVLSLWVALCAHLYS